MKLKIKSEKYTIIFEGKPEELNSIRKLSQIKIDVDLPNESKDEKNTHDVEMAWWERHWLFKKFFKRKIVGINYETRNGKDVLKKVIESEWRIMNFSKAELK